MFRWLGMVLCCLLYPTVAIVAAQPLDRKPASSNQVGAAMAMLATLEDARVLPPEGTPQANRVIKIVIQFQSAFMKSRDPVIRNFFRQALYNTFGEGRGAEIEEAFRKTGWTSSVLEALERYRLSASTRELDALRPGLTEFNLTMSDFDYLAQLFHDASLEYHQRGLDIHQIFANRRAEMPGGKS
ncbi:MAG TPA: hypothetical protein VIU63_11050 [Nitrospira sp.]